ncbi:hypothetical protein VNI00_013863 [Paramarasmius palmivorus]|uniref:Uncharacterized protein n=1 Tax=Paramarasmius palmivorus TaxID=297713 RepID=A0AAW0BVZ1_9AGAR
MEVIKIPLDLSAERTPAVDLDIASELDDVTKDGFVDNGDLSRLSQISLPDGRNFSPHQIAGILWMLSRENPIKRRFGGILADEMGLGKTLQTLAVVMLDPEHDCRPSLIVVQNIMLARQWTTEIKKFFPDTSTKLYHGPSRFSSLQEMQQYKVVVTTYGVVRAEHQLFEKDSGLRTSEICRDALFHTFWRRVALDEAHAIRNKDNKSAKACCDLTATFRWCITATPLQNTVGDLYSLFHFLQVQPFADYNWFKDTIEIPLRRVKPHERSAVNALSILRVGLGHVQIRRRKNDYINRVKILDLPDYKLYLIICELPSDERTVYDALQNRFSALVTKLDLSTEYILVLLLRLRQGVQPDGKEMEPRPGAEAEEDERGVDGYHSRLECPKCKSVYEFMTHHHRYNSLVLGRLSSDKDEARAHRDTCEFITQLLCSPLTSQRLKAVETILSTIPSGEKTVVFSSFVAMLDIISSCIRDRFQCVQYDGGMKPSEREKSLKAIREDSNVKVLLMSLKAGGIGLNLVECNHVILVDLWWNPAVEEQAIGRTHRMGQTRQVYVYKLFAENTVESRIKEIEGKKQALAAAALDYDHTGSSGPSLLRDEIITLITGNRKPS